MNQKIKYGIIGTGLMGREHISNINLIEEAEIIAISDTCENSLNETKSLLNNDIKIYSDYNQIFNINENSFVSLFSGLIYLLPPLP